MLAMNSWDNKPIWNKHSDDPFKNWWNKASWLKRITALILMNVAFVISCIDKIML